MNQAIGIDGCKGGWIMASLQHNQLELSLKTAVDGIWEQVRDHQAVLIDIPIGLLEGENGQSARLCDIEARKMLGKRASSIFPVPCRQAVYVDPPAKETGWYSHWHQAVNQLNKAHLGKGLPIQSLGIVSKIREVDECLQLHKAAQSVFLEAHPEWCFKLLKGQGLVHSKKTEEGQQERIAILGNYIEQFTKSEAASYFKQFQRSKVAKDDILDAICLAVHAHLGQKYGFSAIGNERDKKGISMSISYGNQLSKRK